MDRRRLVASLKWAGAASVVVLVAHFYWLRFYEPTYGEWVVLASGALCPPGLVSARTAWLVSLIRAAQTFVVVFATVMIVTHRHRDR
jgi:hypothetical protein